MTPEQLEKLGLAEGASEEEINAKLDELLATQNSDTSSGGGVGDGGEDDTDNGSEGRGWHPAKPASGYRARRASD